MTSIVSCIPLLNINTRNVTPLFSDEQSIENFFKFSYITYRKPSLNDHGKLARVRANLPGKLPQCYIIKPTS